MITFLDMFAGIGGFRAGLERAGDYECVGHCEKDKHADRAYRAVYDVKESEVFYGDATAIDTDTVPDFDLLCAGFPCQAFSVAGKRQGFFDPRGTMFFEIARILRAKQPAYLLLENVPGLLSHDKGRTFATILHELCELGYSVEWQVLNSKDFGVPQSRQRVFIVGYLNPRCAGKILPIREANAKALIQLVGGGQALRVYDPAGLSTTLNANAGGLGGKIGLYAVSLKRHEGITGKLDSAHTILASDYRGLNRRGTQNAVFAEDTNGSALLIKEATKRGYREAVPGDSVNISFAGYNQKRGRVGKGICNTIDTCGSQGVMTLHGRIRRLMPRECFRLQGFTEDQIDRLLAVTTDAQAYKQAGNAVTVNVVHALGLRLKAAHAALHAATRPREEAA